MKLVTFLATVYTTFTVLGLVAASPARTNRSKKPVRAPLKYEAHLRWSTPHAYKTQKRRKSAWEQKCGIVLDKKGCLFGVIHPGQGTREKGDRVIPFVNVEGASSEDMKSDAKKMRVFRDGTSEDVNDWTLQDLKSMADAGRPRKRPKSKQGAKVHLSWDPIDTYDNQKTRKIYWEQACGEALEKADCVSGIIHKGETKLAIPIDGKRSYLNVEGLQSMDAAHWDRKKLRVFQDGSTEDFTAADWTEDDKRSMASAKYARVPRAPQPQSPTRKHAQGHSNHTISWKPPKAYGKSSRLRTSYEKACHIALERTGCDLATIYKGQHRLRNDRQPTKPRSETSHFLVVSAGKKDEPGGERFMRLFEDGTSSWFPQGRLPGRLLPLYLQSATADETRRVDPPPSGQRRMGRPRGSKARDRESARPTHLSNQVLALVAPVRPGGGSGEHNVNFSPAQPPTQDDPKRPRVGGDGYQFQGTHTPTQAPNRVQASSRDELDLNFLPPDAALPGPSRAPEYDLNFPPAQPLTRVSSSGRIQAPGRDMLDLNLPPPEATLSGPS